MRSGHCSRWHSSPPLQQCPCLPMALLIPVPASMLPPTGLPIPPRPVLLARRLPGFPPASSGAGAVPPLAVPSSLLRVAKAQPASAAGAPSAPHAAARLGLAGSSAAAAAGHGCGRHRGKQGGHNPGPNGTPALRGHGGTCAPSNLRALHGYPPPCTRGAPPEAQSHRGRGAGRWCSRTAAPPGWHLATGRPWLPGCLRMHGAEAEGAVEAHGGVGTAPLSNKPCWGVSGPR